RKTARRGLDAQPHATRVERVRRAEEEPLLGEALQDAGDRTRMEADDVGDLLRGDTRELLDDLEDESLRPRNPPPRSHHLRCALKVMLDAPEQPQEIQRVIERRGVGGARS